MLDQEDVAALIHEVERFAQKILAPALARPEQRLAAGERAALLSQAQRAGLLPHSADAADPDAMGLWSADLDTAAFALPALRTLARASAALAWLMHRRGLAQALIAQLGGPAVPGPALLCLEARIGIGHRALAAWLSDQALSEADQAMLGDVFSPEAPRLVFGDDWQTLLVLGWSQGDLAWYRAERADCHVAVQAHAHGLDELDLFEVRMPASASPCAPARPQLAALVSLDSLARIACGLGLADRGLELSTQYAWQRRQGNEVIAVHAAVQQLLARQRGFIDGAAPWLERHRGPISEPAQLASLLRLRAQAARQCCDALNDAVQVFGGIGYMRDVGVEKLLRDANCLRAFGGTPLELDLIAQALEAQP